MEDRCDKYIKLYNYQQQKVDSDIFEESEKSEKNRKVIVFDLDETIGSFTDLYVLWRAIEKYIHNMSEERIDFNNLLDLYPEFLRHGIINILEFIYHKKMLKECYKLFIYTNNKCSTPEISNQKWISNIIDYLTKKVVSNKVDLFDKIIHSFKINDKIIEMRRSTNQKTYNDFIKCTILPKNTEICFIDNSFFPNMQNERVYYIQPRSYYHYLKTDEIIDRFISSNIFKNIKMNESVSIESILYDWFIQNGRINDEIILDNQLSIDIMISKKMMYYIREFFYLSERKLKTRKIQTKIGRFTRKSVNRSYSK